ncbi:MAG: helix-turn-helix transcriptional regulator [Verrucomicrobia bacterium]|nr:helix-turn-helix transcriptional regulator [Verrucomicrobiota bacterium]
MEEKHVGELIRYHRKKGKLTQKELGLLSGVGKTAVFDIENGKLSVRFDTLLKLLKVLNIDLEFQGPLIDEFRKFIHEKS